MALVYEKTWSQRYTDEQGVTWQLTDLEANDGEVFERWQVLPQDEEPEPASKEATGGDKDEPWQRMRPLFGVPRETPHPSSGRRR